MPNYSSSPLKKPQVALAWSAFGLAMSQALPSFATEPKRPTEPSFPRDTSVDLLEVPDSFEKDDLLDLNIRLGFQHESRSAGIHRETSGTNNSVLKVGDYHESTQRLVPEISLGLMPDLGLTVKLPIILANTRSIDQSGGSTSSAALAGYPGEQLFSVPFASPTRSGLENLTVALDWAIMNQFRRSYQPTWVVGVEGRFNVSEAMHACNPSSPSGQVSCAYPEDRNRDGQADTYNSSYGELSGAAEGSFKGGRSPGVSRGTTLLEGHAYVSRRMKSFEPYSGVLGQLEFTSPGSDFGPVNLEGALVNPPPMKGTLLLGLAYIPWEQPDRQQKLAFDFRFTGTYVTEGEDYSELYDALGSSSAASLRNPNYALYVPNVTAGGVDAKNPSVVDQSSERIHFTGITTVEAHGDYSASLRVAWQAGRYVRFDLGGAVRVIEGHIISYDKACNPDFVGEASLSGPCKVQTGTDSSGDPTWKSTGFPNPNYRASISEPGRRYQVDTSVGMNAWLRASVMF